MAMRPMPFEQELSPEDIENWNEIKLILSNHELCYEQLVEIDPTDAAKEEMDSWIRSMFSRNEERINRPGSPAEIAQNEQRRELSKLLKKINEISASEFLKITDQIREIYPKARMLSQDDFTKFRTMFIESEEMKVKKNSKRISDYKLLQEPNDQRLSNADWFDISGSGELTPLYEPGGRDFAWKYNGQPQECLKSIVLNHPKSCPDIIITTILPKPHQPHQGTEIHSKIALYWCTKVLREDGSFGRSTKTTSEGFEEDWRGVYPLSSEIQTFASCIRENINKLCRTVVTYQRFVLYRSGA